MLSRIKALREDRKDPGFGPFWEDAFFWAAVPTGVLAGLVSALFLPQPGWAVLLGILLGLSVIAYGILVYELRHESLLFVSFHFFWSALLLIEAPAGLMALANWAGIDQLGQIMVGASALFFAFFTVWFLWPGRTREVSLWSRAKVSRLGARSLKGWIGGWPWQGFWEIGFMPLLFLTWPLAWIAYSPVFGRAQAAVIGICLTVNLMFYSIIKSSTPRSRQREYPGRIGRVALLNIRLFWAALCLVSLPAWTLGILQAADPGLGQEWFIASGAAAFMAAAGLVWLFWPPGTQGTMVSNQSEQTEISVSTTGKAARARAKMLEEMDRGNAPGDDRLEAMTREAASPHPPQPSQEKIEAGMLSWLIDHNRDLTSAMSAAPKGRFWERVDRRVHQGYDIAAEESYRVWSQEAKSLHQKLERVEEELADWAALVRPDGPFPEQQVKTPLLILAEIDQQCYNSRRYLIASQNRMDEHLQKISLAAEETLNHLTGILSDVKARIKDSRESLRSVPLQAGAHSRLIRLLGLAQDSLQELISKISGGCFMLNKEYESALGKLEACQDDAPSWTDGVSGRLRDLADIGSAMSIYRKSIRDVASEAQVVLELQRALDATLDKTGINDL